MSSLEDEVHHFWQLNAKEYDKVFSEHYIYGEYQLLKLLNATYETEYEELLPVLQEKFPDLPNIAAVKKKDRIKSFRQSEWNRFERISQYNLTPEILLELDDLLTTKQTTPGPITVPALHQKKKFFGDIQTSLEEIDHNKIFSGTELTNYNIVLDIDANYFIKDHAFNVFFQLGQHTFETTQNISKQNGVFEKGTFVNKTTLGAIATLPNKLFFDFAVNRHERKNNIFAIKMYLENYCKDNNIKFHSEQNLKPKEKNKLLEKMASLQYFLNEEKTLSEKITPAIANRIVQYLTQVYNAQEVDAINETVFMVNYRGYVSSDKRSQLTSREETQISLSTIKALANGEKIADPYINELETIAALLQVLPESETVSIKNEDANSFAELSKYTSLLDQLAKDSWEYWEETHGAADDPYECTQNVIYEHLTPTINKLFESYKQFIPENDFGHNAASQYRSLLKLKNIVKYQNQILPQPKRTKLIELMNNKVQKK